MNPEPEGAHINPEAEGAHINPEAEDIHSYGMPITFINYTASDIENDTYSCICLDCSHE